MASSVSNPFYYTYQQQFRLYVHGKYAACDLDSVFLLKVKKGWPKRKKKEKSTAQTVIKKSSNKQPYRISTLAQMQSEGERANGTSVSCLLVRFLVAQQAK